MFVSTVLLWWHICGLTLCVCVHSGVMVHICGLTLYVRVHIGVMVHICGLNMYVFVHSGVMVSYLYFKNSGKMESKSEAGAGAILKVNCLRFAGVFSYRYLRSDLTHTNKQTHTQNTFFPSTGCTLSSKAHFPKFFCSRTPFGFEK